MGMVAKWDAPSVGRGRSGLLIKNTLPKQAFYIQ
jgi:hypothetical protein